MSGATSQAASADETPSRIADGLRDLLAVVNSSRGLDHILDYVVDQAVSALGGAAAALYLRDDADPSRLCLQAERNLPAAGITPSIPLGYPVMGLAAARRRPVLVRDFLKVLAAPFAASVDQQLADHGDCLEVVCPGPISAPDPLQQDRNRALAERYRSVVALPLVASDVSYGALVLFHDEPDAFSNGQVEHAQAFADQVALAVENAQLRAQAEQRLVELERRRRIAEGLRELLAVVNSGRPLAEMLAAAVDQAVRLLGSQAGAVYLRDDPDAAADAAPQLLSARASHGLRPDQLAVKLRVGSPVTGLAVERRQPVVCHDLLEALADDLRRPAESQLEQLASHVRVLRMGPALDPDLDEQGTPRVRRLTDAFRAVLAVPLSAHGRSYGAITLYYAEPRALTEDDIALAAAFADQAALAVENAYLHVQAEHRLRQLEALYRADQTLHHSLRLENVLQALVDVAADVLQADKTSVLVWDEQHARLVPGATRGFRPETVAQMSHAPGQGVTTIVASTGQPVVVPDALQDPRVAHRITDPEGIRSLMHVPITVGNEVFGVFGVNYCQPHQFSEAELRLLQALAQRAAIAIQNARLYGESEQRRLELESLYHADEQIHGSLRQTEVLHSLVEAATTILHAEKASVLIWDADQQRLVVGAMRGYSPAADALRWVAGEAGIVREALRSDLLPIEDVGTDPRLTPAFREMLEAEAIGSLLSAPIRVADQVFGLFLVGFAEPRLFDEAECRLLLALAGRAGLAIQNARLYEQAQQAAALQERQRLARELHDAVTQTLFSASLIAEVTPRLWERAPDEGRRRLEELRSLTRGALAEMRTLLLELRPGALLETPLSHLLRQLAEATASRAKLAIAVRADGEPKLPPEVQVALYRIAQEALNNTVKHAGATQATLSLEAGSGGGVRLHIVDDGRGFDAAAGAVPAGHLGLGIMRERAQAIGARLELTSQPGGGTRVAVHWPASYPA